MESLKSKLSDGGNIMIGILLFLLVSLIAMFMLTKHKHDIARDLNTLHSQAITLPLDSMEKYVSREYAETKDAQEYCKLIVYTDSVQCSSCALTGLLQSGKLVDAIQSCKTYCRVYFIFAPSAQESVTLKNRVQKSGFSIPVYLDGNHAFIKANPHIPANPIMHAFLTDRDGNVILVGNPFNNQKLLEMALNYLNK